MSSRTIVIFTCSRGGTSYTKKHSDPEKHRAATSKRINCPCRIIARSPVRIAPCWHTTTINTAHNHDLNTEASEFSRAATHLTAEERAKIASYQGRFGTKEVIFLLNQDWSDRTYNNRTVCNAIQAARNAARPSDFSEAAELCSLLQELARGNKDWFVSIELDSKGRLKRIFWMTPSQRTLYGRYHDVVLNDNTFKTNRFNMPFNVFVVVDTDGKNRVVACSLTSAEKTEDYAWILQQLLAANDDNHPHVIIVDEDLAMEAACYEVIPRTTRLNCIWHLGHQNLNTNLHGAMGSAWEQFISAFWKTRNAITQDVFERKWQETVTVFADGKPAAQSYLQRIYDRREHWAWPWVGTKFTAGMQSTQRVESVNANIKKLVHGKTSLPDLFRSIERILSDEAKTTRFLQFRMDRGSDPPRSDFIKKMFSGVIAANAVLGNSAKHQMMTEMLRSIHYRSRSHVPGEMQDEGADMLDDLEEVSTVHVHHIQKK